MDECLENLRRLEPLVNQLCLMVAPMPFFHMMAADAQMG
jgi:hypothetical protein